MTDARATHPRIVLASGSPRRRELLAAAGLLVDVDPADADESVHAGEAPAAYVERVAIAKATIGAGRHPDAAVLGGDTTVGVDGDIFAKPDPTVLRDFDWCIKRRKALEPELRAFFAGAAGSAKASPVRR